MKYPKLTREQSKKFIFITSQRSQSEERYDTDFPGDLVVKTLPSNAGSTDLIPGCFPDSSVGKESACKARDPGSTPGLGRSPGEGIGYPLLYSGLENPMDYTMDYIDTAERLSLSLFKHKCKQPPVGQSRSALF